MDADPELIYVLQQAHSLPPLDAHDLEKFSYTFYAVVIGSTPNRQAAFVRRANTAKVVKPGLTLLAMGNRLRTVDDPLLLVDDRYDLVVGPAGLVALNQSAFEALFRDLTVLETRYDDYVGAIGTVLPVAAEQLSALGDHCRRDSRLGKKLRAISERGVLEIVSIKQLRVQIKRLGLDENTLIVDDQLVFDFASTPTLLKLLNEDLFMGGLTDTPYEASSKATRRP